MADFTASRPIETQKEGAYLHDRSNRPAAPTWTRMQLVRRFAPLAFGLVLAMGFLAIAFQTWASWENHRAWAVALMTPLWVLGGVALAHLLVRREFKVITLGMSFVGFGLILTCMNIWRGTRTDGQDGGRDAMTIISAILFVIAVHSFLIAAVWVEAKRPVRAPAPEM